MMLPPDLKAHLDAMGIRVITPKPERIEYPDSWKPTYKGEEPPF